MRQRRLVVGERSGGVFPVPGTVPVLFFFFPLQRNTLAEKVADTRTGRELKSILIARPIYVIVNVGLRKVLPES